MAKVISIASQKGGVGKTTTAQMLASCIGAKGNKVLVVDFDSQANLTYSSGAEGFEYTIFDVLAENCKIDDAIINLNHYDLLASNEYLANIEMSENVQTTLLRNTILKIADKYDYVIIDTPPALGNLSYNGLVASDYVIVPTEARAYSMQGLGAIYQTICNVQTHQNPNIKLLGILLVKYHDRTVLNRDIRDMIGNFAEKIDSRLFTTSIREGIALAEAQTLRMDLLDYSPKSKPCLDYINLADEILTILGGI